MFPDTLLVFSKSLKSGKKEKQKKCVFVLAKNMKSAEWTCPGNNVPGKKGRKQITLEEGFSHAICCMIKA